MAGRRTPRALEGRTPLEVFEAEEASALQPLPVVPFELARWSRPKVGPDAHAKVGPDAVLAALSADRQAPRRPGQRRHGAVLLRRRAGKDPPLPGQGPAHRLGRPAQDQRVGFFMRNPTGAAPKRPWWAPACGALVDELLSVNALFRLRQAQGVLRLGQRYGDDRLEAACRRAIEAGDPSYKTVKGILAAGTEGAAAPRSAARHRRPGLAARPGRLREEQR